MQARGWGGEACTGPGCGCGTGSRDRFKQHLHRPCISAAMSSRTRLRLYTRHPHVTLSPVCTLTYTPNKPHFNKNRIQTTVSHYHGEHIYIVIQRAPGTGDQPRGERGGATQPATPRPLFAKVRAGASAQCSAQPVATMGGLEGGNRRRRLEAASLQVDLRREH